MLLRNIGRLPKNVEMQSDYIRGRSRSYRQYNSQTVSSHLRHGLYTDNLG